MISRRALIASIAAGLAAPLPAFADAILTEEGIFKQPWFLDSLLELEDDLKAATAAKKRFAIMWELRGCPYCKDTHLINFAKPEIENYIREHFEILQLNILGAREITDFDGEKLSEKKFAAKYGIRGTPTFQFFPESAEGLRGKKPEQREVARLRGYMHPPQFLAAFRFVNDKAYEKMELLDYLKANS